MVRQTIKKIAAQPSIVAWRQLQLARRLAFMLTKEN